MKNPAFSCLCVWYARDLSACRRVVVRPWPRSDVFRVFPNGGSEPFPVVDVHTNSLYVAEFAKVGGRSCAVDFGNLRLICFDADEHFELCRQAYADYIAACAFDGFRGCEHRFCVPFGCPVAL